MSRPMYSRFDDREGLDLAAVELAFHRLSARAPQDRRGALEALSGEDREDLIIGAFAYGATREDPWNTRSDANLLATALEAFTSGIVVSGRVEEDPALRLTPSSSVLLARIAARHLPPGVLNVVCGDRDTGRARTAHRDVALIAVTGSVRAGQEIAAAAAAGLKRVHLELGGNAPVIVHDDVDVEATAASLAAVAYYNAGQDCTAPTRLLVHHRIHDAFLVAFAAATRKLRTGAPDDPDADFGPRNNADQLARVQALLDRVPAHAEIVTGGARLPHPGFFHEPTVVAGVHQEDEMVQEEIFGPVVTVQSFTDEADALRLADGVRFGLAASVWTTDHDRAMRATRALHTGIVWVNTHGTTVSEMPHGGVKHSGYGSDLSLSGLLDYTQVKHVML
ncbi:aldehyde dehydrogenase family protein [Streptomyces sp. NPDC048255]|uniref:aldehyde dehydrogenase family protein n=1 Tax=Streptomyces sp. NPDC048255 TaxID=3154713 RepID=UPI003406CD0D